MKSGKAAGFVGFYIEFDKNFKNEAKLRLLSFYNDFLSRGKIPKEFKRAKILGVVKPGKDGNAPSDYRTYQYLC